MIQSVSRIKHILLSATTLFITLLVSSSLQAKEEYWQYKLQPGEHIWGISHQLLTDWRSWQEITHLNGVKNDRLMAAGTTIKIPASLVNQRQAGIRLIQVSGSVKHFNAQQMNQLAADNMVLREGEQLVTGEDSSALLGFEDGTELLLNEESQLLINKAMLIGNKRKLSDIKVILNQGEVEIRANPKKQKGSNFVIETPAAFATTRGTIYRVRSDAEQTLAEVTQGKIDVANPKGKTRVNASFGTLTKKDSPPAKPRRLLAAPEIKPLDTVRYLPERVYWKAIDNASIYRTQISTSEAFKTIQFDNIASQPKLNLPVELEDGQYWIRVRAIDNVGLQGLESIQAFNIDAHPFPPALQSPLSKTPVYAGEVNFEWTKPQGAAEYLFELAQDETFSQPVVKSAPTDNTHITHPIPVPGDYFWRVTSVTAEGKVGPTGHATKIKVRPVPATPALQEPTNDETTLGFAWQNDPVSSKYQIQLASDIDFNEIVVEQEITSAEAKLPKPKAGTYFMRVRGFDADNFAGGWSSVQQVKVPIDNYLPIIFMGVITGILLL